MTKYLTIGERAIETLGELLDQAGITDRNLGYNNFDEVYERGCEIIQEHEASICDPQTYGETIEIMVSKLIEDFHVLGRSKYIDNPAETVVYQLKMKQFVLEQALEKFETWLDTEAD